MKACSLDWAELASWAIVESSVDPETCVLCKPADEAAPVSMQGDRHLTKLGKDIVDYVVEAAVIHLDLHDSGYDVTVDDIANCLGKTPGQISPALMRLADDGYVRIGGKADSGASSPVDSNVFPTADALRMLPAFEKMADGEVEAELDSLTEAADVGHR